MNHYCLGFVFDAGKSNVLLVKKGRPSWQAGKLNGLGGTIEEGESALQAMIRETWEEAELNIPASDWLHIGTMGSHDWRCDVFTSLSANFRLAKNSDETEPLVMLPVSSVGSRTLDFVDPNVGLFIHAALLQGPIIKEIHLAY